MRRECPYCFGPLVLTWSDLAEYTTKHQVSIRALSQMINQSRSQIYAWRKRGWLSPDQAEKVSEALHTDPWVIWPEYLELAAT